MFKQIGKQILVGVLTFGISVSAMAQASGGDSWVPWPFGFEVAFPWSDIQGTWRVQQGGYVSYFSFKVVRERTSKGRQLVVRQMDSDQNCKFVATGVGYESENIIRAQMTGKSGTYRITLRAFVMADKRDLPVPDEAFQMEETMVLSITNLDWKGESIHLPLAKVSDGVTQKACLEAEKNKK